MDTGTAWISLVWLKGQDEGEANTSISNVESRLRAQKSHMSSLARIPGRWRRSLGLNKVTRTAAWMHARVSDLA